MATATVDNKQGEKEPSLERTPEIKETQSGKVEVRKDPEHTRKLSTPADKIQELGEGGDGVVKSPGDVLAVRRIVDDTDTPLE